MLRQLLAGSAAFARQWPVFLVELLVADTG
jgi:hypothetical protein